jgi:hypothetical protein
MRNCIQVIFSGHNTAQKITTSPKLGIPLLIHTFIWFCFRRLGNSAGNKGHSNDSLQSSKKSLATGRRVKPNVILLSRFGPHYDDSSAKKTGKMGGCICLMFISSLCSG